MISHHHFQELINLKVRETENCSLAEIEELCQQVIHYSVKTSHGRFHNQLFGQLDPFGLAGALVTEAMNGST